jgi:UrcA family protein
MSPSIHAKGLHRMRAAMLSGVIASSFAALSTAEAEMLDAPQVKVTFGDLDVSHPQGATVLYSRILVAARNVCYPYWATSFATQANAENCIRSAIAAAVTTVNQPALSQVYSAKTRTPLPLHEVSLR